MKAIPIRIFSNPASPTKPSSPKPSSPYIITGDLRGTLNYQYSVPIFPNNHGACDTEFGKSLKLKLRRNDDVADDAGNSSPDQQLEVRRSNIISSYNMVLMYRWWIQVDDCDRKEVLERIPSGGKEGSLSARRLSKDKKPRVMQSR